MNHAPDPNPTEETDGRRRRAHGSRARIVAALLALIEEGQISVGAEPVAERAQVGLRTVFRHFKDRESLYREISLILYARLSGEASRPFLASDWRGQLDEMIRRRAELFERITPIKRAEAAERHRSRFLEEDTRSLNQRLREGLRQILPSAVLDQPLLLDSLDLVLSFESWDRLRREQGLSPDQAEQTWFLTVAKLLA